MREATQEEPTTSAGAVASEEESTAPDGATSTDATTDEADVQPKLNWRDLIRDVPPEEILKEHDALKQHFEGRVGQTAQRLAHEKYLPEELAKGRSALAQQIREEESAKLARESRDKRINDLINADDRDSDEAIRELRKLRSEEEAEAKTQVNEDMVRQLVTDSYIRGNADFDAQILHPLFRLLHPEDQRALNGKDYGNGIEARIKYVTDIFEHREKRAVAEAVERVRAEVEADREKSRDKDREALRKELLGEVNRGTRVDTGSGSSGAGGPSLPEILSWPLEQRLEWKKNNSDAYNRAVSASRNGH